MANLSASLEKQSLIPQLDPPFSTAAPSEVRAFITELLILTRNLSAQHAKEIADKWRLGTGRELTTYPPSVHADIFGSEDAWMVYKESQLFIRRAEQEKNKRQDDLRKWAVIIAMTMTEIIGITLSLTIPLHYTDAKGCAITGTIFFTVFVLLYCLGAWLNRSTLEDKVERELHEGMGSGCKKCT